MKKLLFILPIFLLASCLDINKTSTESSLNKNQCVCTFEYNPVCAKGITYDNPCIAKCKGVTKYDLSKCLCDINSGIVCARSPMKECPQGMLCSQVMPSPQQFKNECEMIKAKADFIKKGACP